jgi:ABC-type multidrug transport system fused ATPase/permease subunit
MSTTTPSPIWRPMPTGLGRGTSTVSIPASIRCASTVVPYLWPEGEAWVKRRVVIALSMLVLAKLVAVGTPFLYKAPSTALRAKRGLTRPGFWRVGAVGVTVAYGMARLMNVGFQQLRDAIFARVAQGALRQLALETFQHIHALSLRYHITRKTGGLSRIIERGVKGVEFLLRFLLFSVGPLILELAADGHHPRRGVRHLLPRGAGVTIALYIWFTFKVTEWRVKIRREMNEQDTDANQKAVDSLLNFETVKYFGAERREADAL